MFKLKELYQYKRDLLKKNKAFHLRVFFDLGKEVDLRNLSFKEGSSDLGQGIVFLKASQNNTIIALTDLKGKVQTVKSCGCLGFSGRKKRSTKFAIESTLHAVVQKIKECGWSKVGVYFKGFAKGRFYVLNYLKKSDTVISLIRDITPIPHNGCKPRKLRRG